ncbi:hypothetical protein [Persicitalea sp.]|uniref:hypothetical protein n=1 Tax=Persicitalea sp. TaxID=3100273 RepID=UPI003593C3DB
MKNLTQTFLLIFLASSIFLMQSCKHDVIDVVKTSDTDRVELSSMKVYGLLIDSLNQLNNEEVVGFSMAKLGSNSYLHNSLDTTHFDGRFEYHFPKSFAALLNRDLEFQVGDKIAWFHKGYLFLIPMKGYEKIKKSLFSQDHPFKYAESMNLEHFYLTTGIEKGAATHSGKSARTNDGPSHQVFFSPGTRFLAYSSNVFGYKREIYFNCNDWYNSYNGEYLYQIYYTVEYQKFNFNSNQWEPTNPTSGYFRPFSGVELENHTLNGNNLTTTPSKWILPTDTNIYDFFHGVIRYHYYNLPGQPTNVGAHLVLDSYFEYHHSTGTISGNIDLW